MCALPMARRASCPADSVDMCSILRVAIQTPFLPSLQCRDFLRVGEFCSQSQIEVAGKVGEWCRTRLGTRQMARFEVWKL